MQLFGSNTNMTTVSTVGASRSQVHAEQMMRVRRRIGNGSKSYAAIEKGRLGYTHTESLYTAPSCAQYKQS